ncbi:AraC family transcriptional regulator [Oceanobacillus sp. 1P07AA]|uniref:AraC family transcriptional regulator n=1 Tax=Oceanobacillus sp. 1P07AA TaxID=3132293 RepID=UPI0039A74554
MTTFQNDTIQHTILYIHQHLDEDLTLSKLAQYAAYSPYHFSRVFKKHVGVSPQYYISSVRLQKAKELLLQTNFTIRDIGLEVGQQSLGTFTSRFTKSVGVSPNQFRRMHNSTGLYVKQIEKLPSEQLALHSPVTNTLSGTVEAETLFEGIIFIGLFTKPIPEGLPIVGTVVRNTGNFHLKDIPVGIYYLMATGFPWSSTSTSILIPHHTLRVRKLEPITVDGISKLASEHLILHEPRISDPPILVSLSLLMQNFITRERNTSKVSK